MKILELRSENFKRLSVVQITPDGNIVQITGANAQGKTSVLDSVWAVLGGDKGVPEKPIRKGKASARIEVKIGDEAPLYVVERTFTEKGTYLKVTDPDGAKHQKPQDILNRLMGAIGFDPLSFMRMDSQKQFDLLRGIVKLDVDIDALDRRRAMIYEDRTTLNRDLARLKGAAESIQVPEDLPEEEPDLESLTAKLAGISDHNETVRKQLAQRAILKEEVDDSHATVMSIRAGLQEAEDRLSRETAAYEAAMAEEIAEIQSTDSVMAELDTARKLARGFVAQKRKIEALADVAAAERAAEAATETIASIDAEKRKALAAVSMPVEGLSFTDGEVLFNGLPVTQASAAEQLRISAAIGAALNPTLRVLLCRDGSLLDSKSMALLAEFAQAHDLQVWIERVDETGEVGVVIEDGHVRGQEELVAAAEKNETAPEPPVDDERFKKASQFLADQLAKLDAATTVVTADKLNGEVKVKLAKFPKLVSTEWNPAYLAKVRTFK